MISYNVKNIKPFLTIGPKISLIRLHKIAYFILCSTTNAS